jgi:hypothetical protein
MDVDEEYAGAPPRLLLGLTGEQPHQLQHTDDGDAAAAALSLEERFAAITVDLMRDEINVGDALLALEESCAAHAEQLRCAAGARAARLGAAAGGCGGACGPSRGGTRHCAAAQCAWCGAGRSGAEAQPLPSPTHPPTPKHRDRSSALLHRSAHYLHARALADELASQAATWQLVLHLYAMGEQPAGLGGPGVAGAGGRETYRQALRDAVNGDPRLERVAHVVAWLESLAAQRLAAAPPVGFSAADGLWRETLLLSRAPGGGGAAELDPDAPTRGAAALRGEDQRNEERLAAQLWQLLRAGKLQQAQELCRRCGQHWRAAALAGGGPWGPLPVGAAAADMDDGMDEETQAEDLAWEVRGDGGRLWRRAWQLGVGQGGGSQGSAAAALPAACLPHPLPCQPLAPCDC